jgi:hypothetical protein
MILYLYKMQALKPLLEKLEPDSWACFNKYVKNFNLIMVSL